MKMKYYKKRVENFNIYIHVLHNIFYSLFQLHTFRIKTISFNMQVFQLNITILVFGVKLIYGLPTTGYTTHGYCTG